MSVVLKADVAYVDPRSPAPRTLYVKMAPTEDLVRQTGLAMGLYEAEVRFYNEIAPTVDIRVPHCLFADIDTRTGHFTIVMADSPGAVPGDMLADGTADDAALALEQLVALQAPRWGDTTLRTTRWLQPDGWLEFSKTFPASLEPFLDRFHTELTDTEIRFCERVMPHAVTWMLSWTDLPVLQHGDFRPDNALFATGPDGRRSVTIFDWQAVRTGPPPLDAGHWIGGGFAIEDRRRDEQALLREYHSQLRAAGVDSYSWDDCWEDYQRTALFGLYSYVGAYPQLKHSERGDALFLAAFKRFSAQAIDNQPTATCRSRTGGRTFPVGDGGEGMKDDETQIRELLTIHCYLVDHGRGAEVPGRCFTDDAVDDHGAVVLRGRRELVDFFDQDKLASTTGDTILDGTVHTISNHLVEVDGDRARSQCYVTGWHWMTSSQGEGAFRPAEFVLVALYDDQMVRTDTGWRIERRCVRRIGPGVVGAGEPMSTPLAPVLTGMTTRLGMDGVPVLYPS